MISPELALRLRFHILEKAKFFCFLSKFLLTGYDPIKLFNPCKGERRSLTQSDTTIFLNKNLRFWKVLIDSMQQQPDADTNFKTMVKGSTGIASRK